MSNNNITLYVGLPDDSVINISTPVDAPFKNVFHQVAMEAGTSAEKISLASMDTQYTWDKDKDVLLQAKNIGDNDYFQMIMRVIGGTLTLQANSDYYTLTEEEDFIFFDNSSSHRAKFFCGHVISKAYARSLLTDQVMENNQNFIKCGEDECKGIFNANAVFEVAELTVQEQIQYRKKMTQNFVKQNLKSKKCPACSYDILRPSELKTIRIRCVKCNKIDICWVCLSEWGGNGCSNDKCPGVETDPNSGVPRYSSNQQKNAVLSNAPLREYTYTNPKMQIPTVRACINCNMINFWQKNCKHITCSTCGHEYCQACLKDYSKCGYSRVCEVAPAQQF